MSGLYSQNHEQVERSANRNEGSNTTYPKDNKEPAGEICW